MFDWSYAKEQFFYPCEDVDIDWTDMSQTYTLCARSANQPREIFIKRY